MTIEPKMDTIVPIMGTVMASPSIGGALFGKTQRGLLRLFFLRPEQSFYLRQIVRTAEVGQGAAQRELARWVEAGLLVRMQRGNQVHYQANPACPVFTELKSLAVKTVGVADVIRDALANLPERIHVAFVHGSVARGTEKADSDVDLVVIGTASFGEVTAAIQAAQQSLGREINPTVYPVHEFRTKLRSKHHFVTSLMETPRIYVVGGDRELKRLGTQRVARRTSDQPAGTRRPAQRGRP
ncbi:MAG TPA: nucleotidyltransferase domain-containing protein [Planctomycetaceae bacterium]